MCIRDSFPYYGDVANLDGDNDGEPCESLPGNTTTTTTTTTVPENYVPPMIQLQEVTWFKDTTVCINYGYQQGYTINSQDQTTYVKMSSKLYLNNQLIQAHSPPLGTAEGIRTLFSGLTNGVAYSVRTEIYDRDDQLVQNYTWSTGSFTTGDSSDPRYNDNDRGC